MPLRRWFLKPVCIPFHHTRVYSFGARERNRTPNLLITSELPYHSATLAYSLAQMMGFEPTLFGSTIRCIRPLCYIRLFGGDMENRTPITALQMQCIPVILYPQILGMH